MFVLALGWAAAALAAVLALPQLVRLLRTRSTAGVSVVAWRLTLAAAMAWALHGIYTGQPNVLLPNVILGTLSVLILATLARDRGLNLPRLVVPSLVAAALSLGLDVWAGPLVFAVAAGLPSLAAQLMQLQELVVAPRITGVSVPFLALNVANQVVWLAWALLAGEVSVILCASVLGVVMLANLAWAMMRRRRLVRARLAMIYA